MIPENCHLFALCVTGALVTVLKNHNCEVVMGSQWFLVNNLDSVALKTLELAVG